jgi:hypothetical protein
LKESTATKGHGRCDEKGHRLKAERFTASSRYSRLERGAKDLQLRGTFLKAKDSMLKQNRHPDRRGLLLKPINNYIVKNHLLR